MVYSVCHSDYVFWTHLKLYGKASLFKFQGDYSKFFFWVSEFFKDFYGALNFGVFLNVISW